MRHLPDPRTCRRAMEGLFCVCILRSSLLLSFRHFHLLVPSSLLPWSLASHTPSPALSAVLEYGGDAGVAVARAAAIQTLQLHAGTSFNPKLLLSTAAFFSYSRRVFVPTVCTRSSRQASTPPPPPLSPFYSLDALFFSQEKGVTAVSVLYERFLATPHFSRWFFQRRCAVLTVPNPATLPNSHFAFCYADIFYCFIQQPAPGCTFWHALCHSCARVAAAAGGFG